MIHAVYFILGVIAGVVTVIIISCCVVASDCDRREEKWYEEEYNTHPTDGDIDSEETSGHAGEPETEE